MTLDKGAQIIINPLKLFWAAHKDSKKAKCAEYPILSFPLFTVGPLSCAPTILDGAISRL